MLKLRRWPCALVVAVALGGCGKKEEPAATPAVPTPTPGTKAPVELPAGAKALQPAEVSTKATDVRQSGAPPMTTGEYIVEGIKRYDGWFLSSERIVFKPGAQLIFTKDARAARPNFYVLAKEITSEDPQKPGVITWERTDLVVPPEVGSGTAGSDQPTDDQPGGVGGNGTAGNPGAAGSNAPGLTLVTLSLKGPLLVELKGQDGGPGGKGMKGGKGGHGGKGHPASAQIYQCKNGAGDGGPGGAGGKGGPGGASGDGGRGGTFTLITSPENLAVASRLLKVDTSGGQAGTAGGVGGDGGEGGTGGGRGAKSLPYCKDDGRDGATGGGGAKGDSGPLGKVGTAGDFFVGDLSPNSVTELLTKR